MRILISGVVLALCVLPIAADDTDLEGAISAVRTAFDAHEKVKATLDLEARIPMGANRITMNGTGGMAYEKAGPRYAQGLNMKMPEPFQMEVEVEILSIGDQAWVTTKMMGNTEVKQETPDIGRGAIPPGGGLLFDLLDKDLELKLLPEKSIDGTPVYAFEGRPTSDANVQYVKAEFDVEKESGLLREARLYETEGALTVKITQHSFDFEPDFSDVNFDPPKAAGGGGGAGADTPPAAGGQAPGAGSAAPGAQAN